jgi:NAD(P)-dependent dehydrogenase (short-subunit alcohol dehydrogenase family)
MTTFHLLVLVEQRVVPWQPGILLICYIYIVQLDVIDDESVKNAMQSIISEASGIDVLVNNAGYAGAGAFEDVILIF